MDPPLSEADVRTARLNSNSRLTIPTGTPQPSHGPFLIGDVGSRPLADVARLRDADCMHYLSALLMLQQTPAMMPHIPDPQRVEKELAADAEVLRSLRDNGDESSLPRPVDVRFVGAAASVARLQKQISSMGWRVVQRVPVDADTEALDIQRDQTTEPAAIRRLTEAALEIEGRFDVRYDGWGTVATKR